MMPGWLDGEACDRNIDFDLTFKMMPDWLDGGTWLKFQRVLYLIDIDKNFDIKISYIYIFFEEETSSFLIRIEKYINLYSTHDLGA